MSSSRAQSSIALGLAAACLGTACLVPLIALAGELLTGDAAANLRDTLGQARLWSLLARSVGLAAAVTAVALIVGVPLGALLARTDVAGRRAALVVHAFPLFLPPFLLAFGWFHVFARGGALGSAWTSRALFSPVGAVAILGLAFAPVVTALTALGLHGIDPSLEEAARTTSRPRRVVTRILLPLAWPSIALSALVVFALALSEIGVPMFLGVRTYTAAVFTRLASFAYAPGEAVALVLPLVALALALVAVDHRLLRRGSFAALGARSRTAEPMPLGRWRVAASAGVWLACALPLAPLVALAAVAGAAGVADALPWIGDSLRTSLVAGAGAATVVVAAGLVVGHALARGGRVAAGVDAVAMFAFLLPSSVLGIGLVTAWNRSSTQLVYATGAILVLGLAARYGFLGVRTLAAVFHRSSPHYEEAAAAAGAGYLRRLARIVAPMHWRGIAAAWLIALVFCLRDLDAVATFYPPGLEPLPVRIFTLEANGAEPIVAGLSLVHVAVTAALVAAGGALLTWRGRRR